LINSSMHLLCSSNRTRVPKGSQRLAAGLDFAKGELLLGAFERMAVNFHIRIDEVIEGRAVLPGLEHQVAPHGKLDPVGVE